MEAEPFEQKQTDAPVQEKFVYSQKKKIPLVQVKREQIFKLTYPHEKCTYDEDGFLPIHRSVLENDEEKLNQCIQDLLNNNCNIDVLTKFHSMTSLQLALKYERSLAIVTHLLSNDANPLYQDSLFNNAFHYSINLNDDSYLQMLIHHMDKFSRLIYNHSRHRDYLNKTKNVTKEKKRHKSIIKQDLLKLAFTAVNEDGYTPIMECISKKKIYHLYRILQCLPKAVREEIINFKNPKNGKTCLFLLQEFNLDPLFTNYFSLQSKIYTKLLLHCGSDPNIEDYCGFSPQTAALRLKKTKLHKFFVKYNKRKNTIYS